MIYSASNHEMVDKGVLKYCQFIQDHLKAVLGIIIKVKG
jgi:hypothetical protein